MVVFPDEDGADSVSSSNEPNAGTRYPALGEAALHASTDAPTPPNMVAGDQQDPRGTYIDELGRRRSHRTHGRPPAHGNGAEDPSLLYISGSSGAFSAEDDDVTSSASSSSAAAVSSRLGRLGNSGRGGATRVTQPEDWLSAMKALIDAGNK